MKRALWRTTIALIALGAVFAAQTARAEDDDKTPKPLPPQQKNFPLDQTWSLRELNGKPVDSTLDVSLKIDSALRGSGFDGCNSCVSMRREGRRAGYTEWAGRAQRCR